MKGYVYILQSASSGRYYIGTTNDPGRRFLQHRRGHTHTTKRMKQPVLRFLQSYPSLKAARIVERRLKSLKRRDYIDKIVAERHIRIS